MNKKWFTLTPGSRVWLQRFPRTVGPETRFGGRGLARVERESFAFARCLTRFLACFDLFDVLKLGLSFILQVCLPPGVLGGSECES